MSSLRREWVAKCLGQMTDTNRTEAQVELRQVIADAFAAQTLWTTDWPGVELKRQVILIRPGYRWASCSLIIPSLAPKPPINLSHLKRKRSVFPSHPTSNFLIFGHPAHLRIHLHLARKQRKH
jgi:hypothetical protein